MTRQASKTSRPASEASADAPASAPLQHDGDGFALTIDETGAVQACEGPALAAWIEGRLGHASVYELFPPKNRSIAMRLVASVFAGKGLEFYDVAVVLPPAGPRTVFRMVPKREAQGQVSLIFHLHTRQSGGGLVDAESFLDAATGLVTSGSGDPLDLMMFEFGCLREPALAAKLGSDEWKALRQSIERALEERAEEGTVGHLGAGAYGLVAAATVPEALVRQDVEVAAQVHGLAASDLQLRSTSVDLSDGEGLKPSAIRSALGHLSGQFAGTVERLFSPAGAKLSLRGASAEVDALERTIREAVRTGAILLKVRVVFDVASQAPAHLLSEGQVEINDRLCTVASLLRLDDVPDLALEHDLRIADTALHRLKATKVVGDQATSFMPISQAALRHPQFEPRLAALMVRHGLPAHRLGLRTLGLSLSDPKSPPMRAVSRLRAQGHPIWLTHFTAAVSGMRQSNDLAGCYVEVATSYVTDLCRAPDGEELLGRMLSVWKRAGVQVIATGPLDEAVTQSLQDLSIPFALQPSAPLAPATRP
ncbi:MAG: EAL domain-containing protein [Pseudomonadota bacterium]